MPPSGSTRCGRLFARPPTRQICSPNLVCSNSLKSESLEDASGLLKTEMRSLESVILQCAEAHRVPAGSALAVDRERISRGSPRPSPIIPRSRSSEKKSPASLDHPIIVATGPLTSDRLAADLAARFAVFLGPEHAASRAARWLYFYDAISPIVAADSINRDVVYAAARYGVGGADYLNCPLTQEEYGAFREALLRGERYPLHDFERPTYFEGCLPIEELAERGEDTLRFGPMRPVGLRDPRTGKRPLAVVQLRQENHGPDGRSDDVQPGRLSDAAPTGRSGDGPPPDPGVGAGGDPAVRECPSEHVP